MSYQVYKMIHVVSIVLFFALYMSASVKDSKNIKKEVIFSGIILMVILVSGFGLIARLGMAHGAAWPLWLKLKLAIWTVIGLVGHTILKRFAAHRLKFFWIAFVLLICASYLANYKIG
ncbi:MAG: hypothetical protein KC478_17700 [Bacteriovoracaceae bacterium]|nr:hypothetical protein [Bacteriovoracaceae bacterium]